MVFFGVVAQAGGFHFGLGALEYRQVAKIARKSEELGFDYLVYPNHLFFARNPFPETWTTLAALALETKRIKIGTHVACYSYLPPPIVAKMVANVDRMSKGRFHFGIGACGWGQDVEHAAYGLSLQKPIDRIRALREAVIVIRKMLMEDSPSFHGSYFSISKAHLDPKPVQAPFPIWIGGSGSKLLQVVAEQADGWDTGFARPADYDRMRSRLESACQKIGRDGKRIRRGFSSYQTIISSGPKSLGFAKKKFLIPLLESKRRHREPWVREMPEREYIDKRSSISGTVDDVIAKLDCFIKSGVRHFFLNFADFPSTSMLELFAEKVIPEFKRA